MYDGGSNGTYSTHLHPRLSIQRLHIHTENNAHHDISEGETRTFVKAQRLKHAICLESSLKHLDLYRSQVKGWVSDQGTEKAVPQTFLGDTARLQEMTSSLQEGSSTLEAMLATSKQSFSGTVYGTPGICTSCSMPWKKLAKAALDGRFSKNS